MPSEAADMGTNEASSGLLTSIIEASTDAIVSWDLDGVVTSWNPGAERLYSIPKGDAVGQHIHIIIPSERAGELEVVMELVRKGKRVEHFETTHVCRGGRLAEVSLTVAPLVDETEKVVGAASIARDLTDSKVLVDRLADKTRALERMNAELEQFAHVVAHDLREPLRMVTCFTQLLSDHYDGQLDERAQRYISHASGAARRMGELLAGLLEYSHLDRLEATEMVPLDRVVDAVISDYSVTLAEEQASISRDPLPAVYANEAAVRLVFQNLIENALKYRGDAAPEVHVSAKQASDHWEFTVQDNGIGIEKEYHDRIFGMFQRLWERERYPGTGAGLAIVKKVVERCGGRIWVESEPGEGAGFHFTMPRHAD